MKLIEMSFYGAVLILVVLGIRGLFLNKFPKRVFPVLWMVVLIRLLVPASVPSDFSVYSIFALEFSAVEEAVTDTFTNQEKEKTETMQEEVTAENWTGQKDTTFSEEVKAAQEVQAATAGAMGAGRMSLDLFAIVIWFAGALLSAGFLIISYVKYRREFADSLPVEEKFVKEWLTEHPLARKVTVRQSAKVEAPLTFGIFRPVILMPASVDWTDGDKLDYVLTHEMVHIRRFDSVVKFLMNAAFCLHWFNPFVWLMTRYLNRDLELSCDETVVLLSGENKKADYARTLISMEEKKSSLYPLGSSFSKNAIEERIKAIMKMKKRSLTVIIFAVLLVAAVAVGLGTSSNGKKKAREQAKEIVFDTFEAYFDMFEDVWVYGPKLEDIIISSDTCPDDLVKAEDPRFTSLEDVKAATETACTKAFAEKEYYEKYIDGDPAQSVYVMKDGNLYRKMVEFGGLLFGYGERENAEVTILEQTPERIKADVGFMVDRLQLYWTVTITIVNENGTWLVDGWEDTTEDISGQGDSE